jgi:hypothetical protein
MKAHGCGYPWWGNGFELERFFWKRTFRFSVQIGVHDPYMAWGPHRLSPFFGAHARYPGSGEALAKFSRNYAEFYWDFNGSIPRPLGGQEVPENGFIFSSKI